jgi:hypothetical protein
MMKGSKASGLKSYRVTQNIHALRDLFNHSASSITLRYIGVEGHVMSCKNSGVIC